MIEAALGKDDVVALGEALQSGLWDCLHARSGPQKRDLLSQAAAAGASACVAALLAAGACPNAPSPYDGNTALHCACSHANSSTARVIAVLVKGGANKELKNHAGFTPSDVLAVAAEASQAAAMVPSQDCDLLRPSYSTDHFRMFSFKIDCCPRLAESHDWTLCPFQHPGEKARRRDPRRHAYQGVPCPDFRKGTCKRGDACHYAHGVFECWLHPSRYRTQLCKEGSSCRRSVCFFAHSVAQLREPTMQLKTEAAEPASPRGPLLSAEESEDTYRSRSPSPNFGDDGAAMMSWSSGLLAHGSLLPAEPRHQHMLSSLSCESSLSSTPVLGSASSGSFTSETSILQRNMSSLSLPSDDMAQSVLHQVPAGSWPPVAHDHLGALLAAGKAPLAGSLHGVVLPDAATLHAAVQAATLQHRLAMLQAVDAASLLPTPAGAPGLASVHQLYGGTLLPGLSSFGLSL
ncbi:Zinc finger CCCH domain-containing protein 66 [Chlorella vulgaris]